MPTESPEEGASFAVVIADPPILSCKDRAGRALLSGCSTNERSAFFAVPPPFLGDEDSIGGSALCALVCSKKNRDGRVWRWWRRPSCWRQVPVPWQIRPIDHHKPLIRRVGDRGHYSSRLALIRERTRSRRLVHSLLQSARAHALPSTPPVCARDRSLSVHRWAPGRARGPTGAVSSPFVTGGSVAQRPRLICHRPPHHHRTTTTHSRPLLTGSSTTQRVLSALRVILNTPAQTPRTSER